MHQGDNVFQLAGNKRYQSSEYNSFSYAGGHPGLIWLYRSNMHNSSDAIRDMMVQKRAGNSKNSKNSNTLSNSEKAMYSNINNDGSSKTMNSVNDIRSVLYSVDKNITLNSIRKSLFPMADNAGYNDNSTIILNKRLAIMLNKNTASSTNNLYKNVENRTNMNYPINSEYGTMNRSYENYQVKLVTNKYNIAGTEGYKGAAQQTVAQRQAGRMEERINAEKARYTGREGEVDFTGKQKITVLQRKWPGNPVKGIIGLVKPSTRAITSRALNSESVPNAQVSGSLVNSKTAVTELKDIILQKGSTVKDTQLALKGRETTFTYGGRPAEMIMLKRPERVEADKTVEIGSPPQMEKHETVMNTVVKAQNSNNRLEHDFNDKNVEAAFENIMSSNINKFVDRIYSQFERRLKLEKVRRGL